MSAVGHLMTTGLANGAQMIISIRTWPIKWNASMAAKLSIPMTTTMNLSRCIATAFLRTTLLWRDAVMSKHYRTFVANVPAAPICAMEPFQPLPHLASSWLSYLHWYSNMDSVSVWCCLPSFYNKWKPLRRFLAVCPCMSLPIFVRLASFGGDRSIGTSPKRFFKNLGSGWLKWNQHAVGRI